jgi:hypothetical protein
VPNSNPEILDSQNGDELDKAVNSDEFGSSETDRSSSTDLDGTYSINDKPTVPLQVSISTKRLANAAKNEKVVALKAVDGFKDTSRSNQSFKYNRSKKIVIYTAQGSTIPYKPCYFTGIIALLMF